VPPVVLNEPDGTDQATLSQTSFPVGPTFVSNELRPGRWHGARSPGQVVPWRPAIADAQTIVNTKLIHIVIGLAIAPEDAGAKAVLYAMSLKSVARKAL
jgi:hypothetical protein